MKHLFVLLFISFSTISYVTAQENYGRVFNLGLGVGGYSGYSSYLGRSLPVLHLNYEINVAKNFTVAPFISFYTFSNEVNLSGNGNQNRNYRYRQTVVPIGAKGTYYFDDLLNASSDWDFYLGASLGFTIFSSSWDADYPGDRNFYGNPSALYVDIHIGTEYHLTNQLGLFLDLSTGMSSIGVSIHRKK